MISISTAIRVQSYGRMVDGLPASGERPLPRFKSVAVIAITRRTALRKSANAQIFSEVAPYQKLRRIRGCSGEVATRGERREEADRKSDPGCD